MKIITNLLADLWRNYIPDKSVKDYRFAFIVHPRNLNDVYKKFPLFKFLPLSLTNLILRKLFPLTVSNITGLKSSITGNNLLGYVISIPITTEQMLSDRNLTLKKLTQAVNLAENKGVKMIALGALTSSLTNGGVLLKEKSHNVGITTGHAYTGISVTETLEKLCAVLGIDLKKEKIAIVGATGSIGSISAEILARSGITKFLLIDIDRKKERFENLLSNLYRINKALDIEITSDMNLLKNVRLVVTATNAKDAVIKSEHISPGTVIVDDAQPSDVDIEVVRRSDVLVAEAGVVHTPGISTNFNIGLKHREDNFCCMAELLVLAMDEHNGDFILNRANLKNVDYILKLKNNTNFRVGNIQNRLGYVDIDRFKLYTGSSGK